MSDQPGDDATLLRRECRVFSHYLGAMEPSEYVVAQYRRCHATIPCRRSTSFDPVDRLLVRAARAGPLSARVADAYARRVRPNGALRQKLVLMLAILENAPESHARFNSATSGGPMGALVGVLLAGLAGVASLVVGVLVLGPMHLVSRLRGGVT